ncbi:MAG: hypothetical protein U1G07_21005 [Verrucomicrobiota bacterium]
MGCTRLATREDIRGLELTRTHLIPVRPHDLIQLSETEEAHFTAETQSLDTLVSCLIARVKEFHYERSPTDKMPRANAWRPYRLAVQNHLVGCAVLRHAKEYNCIEVDVFLTDEPRFQRRQGNLDGAAANHPPGPYEPWAAAKALTLVLLSEAFRCSAAMMLRFTANVGRTPQERARHVKIGRVPFAIVQLANHYGTPVPDADSGILRPEEAGPLDVALTGFSAPMRRRIDVLVAEGKLSLARACYLVHHGVWTAAELRILSSCPNPDLILRGEIQPEALSFVSARASFMPALLCWAGCWIAPASKSFSHDGEAPLEVKHPKGRAEGSQVSLDSVGGKPVLPQKVLEDVERDLTIEFDPNLAARGPTRPRAKPAIPLPDWRPAPAQAEPGVGPASLEPAGKFIALLRAWDSSLLVRLDEEIATAAKLPRGQKDRLAIVVPSDFDELSGERQLRLLRQADEANLWLMVCPESVRSLDGSAREKLNSSRMLPH